MNSFLGNNDPIPSSPDTPRVFVLLNSGTKILVPTSQHATVHDIHRTALFRAQRFGVQGTTENTILETTGSGAPVALSGEDALYDVLDLTEDNTFGLRFVGAQQVRPDAVRSTSVPYSDSSVLSSSTSRLTLSSTPKQPAKDRLVYVRWITLEDAVEYLQLRKIPIDDCPFPSDTTLAEFYREAVGRLCRRLQRGACLNPKMLNLYLKECALKAENSTSTLGDLDLIGDRTDPLDIFVEFIGPETRHTLEHLTTTSDPSEIWSFDASRRGICTLVTSIQILIHEIEHDRCTIDGILATLLDLTHFPPLLLSFRQIYQTGLKATSPAGPFLLVASAIHAISRKMVPSFLSPTTDNLLETSRQVAAYIVSLCPPGKSHVPLVQPVEIQEITDEHLAPSSMQHSFEQKLPQPSSTKHTTLSVKFDEDNPALGRLLALAINDHYSPSWDFYFTKNAASWAEFLDNWLTPTPAQSEFDHLIQTTNSRGAFRMIGPLQLGKCLAAELPVITLSPSGYVSRYDQEDFECSEKKFYIWNALEKKVDLPHIDSGQFISQKLEPVIASRKKDHAWELDAWAEWSDATDFGPPDEAVVICVDVSDSMNLPMGQAWLPGQDTQGAMPSRLMEVKEFFKNFALRISALGLPTHLGLVTFASQRSVKVQQQLTPLHLNFHQKLEDITAAGPTAIFDALSKASVMLKDIQQRHPKTKCRIVLLTDGDDNSSTITASSASSELYDNDIVLDAVVIGTAFTSDLFKVARMTGGYAFAPATQAALFQIFLLETVVDIRTRPDIVPVPLDKTSWLNFTPKSADMADPYDFPPCRPHPNLEDYFIALKDADRFLTYMSRRPAPSFENVISDSIRSTVPTGLSSNHLASSNTSNTRILLSEVKAMIENPHDYIDVYVSESNMGFWKVVIQGPSASAYEDGVFLLYVEIGAEFPRRPPNARFVTPVLHPNITKVCHYDPPYAVQTLRG